jgi:hypothetical protein
MFAVCDSEYLSIVAILVMILSAVNAIVPCHESHHDCDNIRELSNSRV